MAKRRILSAVALLALLAGCTSGPSSDSEQSSLGGTDTSTTKKLGEAVAAGPFEVTIMAVTDSDEKTSGSEDAPLYTVTYRIENISDEPVDTCEYAEPIVATDSSLEGQSSTAAWNGSPEFSCGILSPGDSVERSAVLSGPDALQEVFIYPGQDSAKFELYGTVETK